MPYGGCTHHTRKRHKSLKKYSESVIVMYIWNFTVPARTFTDDGGDDDADCDDGDHDGDDGGDDGDDRALGDDGYGACGREYRNSYR